MCVSVVCQTGHMWRLQLCWMEGINKKASGAAAGRCEKWSNLLLSWNQWDKPRCWALPLQQRFFHSCCLSSAPSMYPSLCLSLSLPLHALLSLSFSACSAGSMLNEMGCAQWLWFVLFLCLIYLISAWFLSLVFVSFALVSSHWYPLSISLDR